MTCFCAVAATVVAYDCAILQKHMFNTPKCSECWEKSETSTGFQQWLFEGKAVDFIAKSSALIYIIASLCEPYLR